MKKIITLMLCAAAAVPAFASIRVTVKGEGAPKMLKYQYAAVADMAASTRPVTDSVPFSNGVAVIDKNVTAPTFFSLNFGGRNYISLYELPGDKINVEVSAMDPFQAKASGSVTVEDINAINDMTAPIIKTINEAKDDASRNAGIEQYNKALGAWIESHAASPAVGMALLNMTTEAFNDQYAKMGESAKNSALWPLVERQKKSNEARAEKERKQAELASGDKMAPDFTLKDINGKDLALSSLRGKWLIIDFWGSWCKWCIKGFPDLKEAYKKYAGRLEILGVDNGDTEEAWKAAVKRFELPWLQVYNPKDSNVLDLYGVQGFPTKAIITPEGKVAAIVVGEDPAFFTKLDELMK